MPTFTNIEILTANLREVFDGMLKSEELTHAGEESAYIMGNNVLAQLHEGPYSYMKTGELEELINDQIQFKAIKSTSRELLIGFGELDNMNHAYGAKRNVEYQHHMIGGKMRLVILKEEKQLPKWVIAEFGAWNGASVPTQFDVGYAHREKNHFLVGPSATTLGVNHESTHHNEADSKGNYSQGNAGFFMADESLMRHMGYERESGHSAIKAGHIFSKGLESSKEEVQSEIASGIEKFLRRNFGEVDVE